MLVALRSDRCADCQPASFSNACLATRFPLLLFMPVRLHCEREHGYLPDWGESGFIVV
ncbi:MAG: hypothetical protein QF781_00530 [Phycisphaerales bacterium]|jgi:hypothetical protein|nr:hypothetical protein [Phycisphaerales bacterium]